MVFESDICLECNDFDQCPVSKGKKACYYRYKKKDIRIARRRQNEKSSGFKEKYRYRAGVEATMSEYDRRTGVKHLRVRGMKAVKFAATMKAVGLNIFRAARYKILLTPQCAVFLAILLVYSHVKEQILRQLQKVVEFGATFYMTSAYRREVKF